MGEKNTYATHHYQLIQLVGELPDQSAHLQLLGESAQLVLIRAVNDLAALICCWSPVCLSRACATCWVRRVSAAILPTQPYSLCVGTGGAGVGTSGVSLTDQGRPHSRRRQTFGSFTAGCGVGGIYPWQQGSCSSREWSQQAT